MSNPDASDSPKFWMVTVTDSLVLRTPETGVSILIIAKSLL